MERIYGWLLAAGYPQAGIDWLRRLRLPIIMILALVAWVLVLVAGWLLFSLILEVAPEVLGGKS